MGIISWGSTGSFSSEATRSLLLPLLRALLPWADPGQLEFLHVALRKTGHLIEYAILAWLWFRALLPGTTPGGFARRVRTPGRCALLALAISVAAAGLDELHQAWTEVRTGSAVDVLWDGAGAAAALGLLSVGWPAAVTFFTTTLLWTAAAGGTFLLLLHVLTGTPGRWLWASAPLAWVALWGWRRLRRGPVPYRSPTVRGRGAAYTWGATPGPRPSPMEGLAMAQEEKVGTVTGYYAKIGVAAIHLTEGDLRVGDQIRIRGHTTDFSQRVESLQVEHQSVQQAERGSEVALKVLDRVRSHDQVFRLRE